MDFIVVLLFTVRLSKLLEYDVESGLGVARVVDRLKNNSTNSFVFYQSLSTHQDKFQFHVWTFDELN